MNRNSLKHRATLRTTVTLEADVADFIQETISKNKGLKEKELINQLLRSGIKSTSEKIVSPFKISGFKTRFRPDIDAKKIEELLDEI